jgi:hypothetical protein
VHGAALLICDCDTSGPAPQKRRRQSHFGRLQIVVNATCSMCTLIIIIIEYTHNVINYTSTLLRMSICVLLILLYAGIYPGIFYQNYVFPHSILEMTFKNCKYKARYNSKLYAYVCVIFSWDVRDQRTPVSYVFPLQKLTR